MDLGPVSAEASEWIKEIWRQREGCVKCGKKVDPRRWGPAAVDNRPPVLNCMHMLCSTDCLEECKNEGLIQCPKCLHSSPEIQKSVSVVVGRREEYVLCTRCVRGSVTTAVCAICEDTMCSKCQENHAVIRKTATHQVTPVSLEMGISLPFGRNTKECTLDGHGSSVVNEFCHSCREFLCTSCTPEHDAHTVEEIHLVAENFRETLRMGIHKFRDFKESVPGLLIDAERKIQEGTVARVGLLQAVVQGHMNSRKMPFRELRQLEVELDEAEMMKLSLQRIVLQIDAFVKVEGLGDIDLLENEFLIKERMEQIDKLCQNPIHVIQPLAEPVTHMTASLDEIVNGDLTSERVMAQTLARLTNRVVDESALATDPAGYVQHLKDLAAEQQTQRIQKMDAIMAKHCAGPVSATSKTAPPDEPAPSTSNGSTHLNNDNEHIAATADLGINPPQASNGNGTEACASKLKDEGEVVVTKKRARKLASPGAERRMTRRSSTASTASTSSKPSKPSGSEATQKPTVPTPTEVKKGVGRPRKRPLPE